jgi:hypothetical protein
MDNPPEVHTAQVVEQSAVELSNDQPNEVDNPGQANAVAALTEAFALQESDEHPLGDEIRRQVCFSRYEPSSTWSNIFR